MLEASTIDRYRLFVEHSHLERWFWLLFLADYWNFPWRLLYILVFLFLLGIWNMSIIQPSCFSKSLHTLDIFHPIFLKICIELLKPNLLLRLWLQLIWFVGLIFLFQIKIYTFYFFCCVRFIFTFTFFKLSGYCRILVAHI